MIVAGKELLIPKEIEKIAEILEKKGFEAYLVGGCVRDLLLGKKPKDWDFTTNAKPEQIIASFEKTFYENDYGTVGVVNETSSDETLKVVEITPYRLESAYSDKRRPDSVSFSDNIYEDLKRRDFTINAIALSISKGQLIDPHKGQEDIALKIVRAVGDPVERFSEDALRMLRAIRIATELNFTVEDSTTTAVRQKSDLITHISGERVRDELMRIIGSDRPMDGLIMAQNMGILKFILPELEGGIGVKQNKAHAYDVWEHSLRTLQHAAKKKFPSHVRIAALFHDIGKPDTRRWSEEKKEWTFYGHDVVGARITKKILQRLKFPKDTIEIVSRLVRWHMFFSDTETITLSAVRRMISNVGKEYIWDLMDVRICDRIGTGRPKESPYRLRKYRAMVDEASRDPLTVGMLKINGEVIIRVTKINPGPKIGYILHALLEEVLDDPNKNSAEYLEKKALELSLLSEKELQERGEQGKTRRKNEEGKVIKEIRSRHWVD